MPAGSILVADDDTAIRTVLNQALSRAGYEVRLTGNAATLWRWVSQGEGDLVITDVVMPDENAFDLLPRIKKMRPNLPRSEEHTSELQSQFHLVCRLLLEKKKKKMDSHRNDNISVNVVCHSQLRAVVL